MFFAGRNYGELFDFPNKIKIPTSASNTIKVINIRGT